MLWHTSKMTPVSLIFTVLASYFCFAVGQSCSPPGGGRGVCKSFYDCPPLLKILQNKDKTKRDTEILKNSKCRIKGESVSKICCPEPCYTPDGQPGECVSIYSCPRLANMLKPPASRRQKQYVRKSKCKSMEKYGMCCAIDVKVSVAAPGVCANSVSAFPPDPRTECCGVDSRVGDKIIGGNATSLEQYPWLVLIEYLKEDYIVPACGGSLISGRYVLTAAHCVVGDILNKAGVPVSIRLGEYDTNNSGRDCAPVSGGGTDCADPIVQIPIEQIIPHPKYSTSMIHSPNDIALIRLRKVAPFTDFIRPICLPRKVDVTASRPANFIMIAAGWGLTASNKSSNLKMHVDLPYAERHKCQQKYLAGGRNVSITPKQICAGGVRGKDSCRGDSGGPLMYENTRTNEVIGVVSYGPTPCGLADAPGVYTKVFKFLPWIWKNIVA